MKREIAERLINELNNNIRIIKPDSKLFLDILVSANVPESSRFYEILPDKEQIIEETDRCHYFSLRRILRNKNARNYKLSQWKKLYEAVVSAFGIYSSDALSRNLRADKTLVGMMAECEEPFSLLGKFQTYDFSNPEETLFVATKPILIIPGIKEMKTIRNWEESNTVYEKEVGLFFKRPKTIKPQEYFSQ